MDISCAQTNGWDIIQAALWMAFVLCVIGVIAIAILFGNKKAPESKP